MIVTVLGTARAGSSIVGRNLAESLGLAFVGEIKFFPSRLLAERARWRCSCGRSPQWECPVWAPIHRRVTERVVDASTLVAVEDRRRRSGRRTRSFATYADHLADIVSELTRIHGRPLVDTSKDLQVASALQARGIDVRPLLVVRDPRAVEFSRLDRPHAGRVRGSTARMAANWTTTNRAAMRFARAHDRAGVVRYEDFCRDAEAVVADVRRALGLPGHLATVPTDVGLIHDFSANPRQRDVGTAGHEVRLDREWERRLPASRRRLVELLTWPTAGRFGYGAGDSPGQR